MTNLEHTSLGIRTLDRMNEELLRDIAELERKLKRGQLSIDHSFRKEIVRLTRKFKLYFAEQERWLEEHRFTVPERQKKSHHYFLCEIGRASAALEAHRERAEELTAFLKNWFVAHIRGMEGSLKNEARRKGVADRDQTPFAIVLVRPMALVSFPRFLPATLR